MTTAGRIARNTMANWLGVGTTTLVLVVLTPYVV
jgi:hypothetical protein